MNNKNILFKVDWTEFLKGEVQLICQEKTDAYLLLEVCKKNNIKTGDIKVDDYLSIPYWYILNNELVITKIVLDNDNLKYITIAKDFMEQKHFE